jgi:ubiquinone/menaquinone biosynthesis C-methylase UbiE
MTTAPALRTPDRARASTATTSPARRHEQSGTKSDQCPLSVWAAETPEPVAERPSFDPGVRRRPSSHGMLIATGVASKNDGVAYNDYDALARSYSARNESNAWNAHYERPAVLRMLGHVRDADVLDVGCGAGAHAVELYEQGARVTGIDSSRAMLDIAAGRLGPDVPLLCASIEERLPFADDSFDAILASLVMHYVEDWTPVLREFRRVLRDSGRLVISTHHPFMDHALAQGESYLQTYSLMEEWGTQERCFRCASGTAQSARW